MGGCRVSVVKTAIARDGLGRLHGFVDGLLDSGCAVIYM
jgi:hypothetical protein